MIRAPISRRARSVSARRSTSARERASWSISSAFAIADRGMVGQGPDEGDLRFAVRADARGVRAHGAEDAVADHHRGDDEGADPEGPDEPVGALEVDEGRVVRIVVADDGPAFGGGPAEHARPGLDLELADPAPALVVGDPGVVGEPEDAGRRIEQVGERAGRVQEPGRLLQRVVEDRLVLRRDGRGGAPRDDPADRRRDRRDAARAASRAGAPTAAGPGADGRASGWWWPRSEDSRRIRAPRSTREGPAYVICRGGPSSGGGRAGRPSSRRGDGQRRPGKSTAADGPARGPDPTMRSDAEEPATPFHHRGTATP